MKRVVEMVRSILLVEDNPGDADLIRTYLEDIANREFVVTHVLDLRSAMATLDSATFDVVLLDLRLPDASGVECVAALRIGIDDLPIVVLTGVDDDETAIACIAAGAQDYIPKSDLKPLVLHRAVEYAIIRAREAAQRLENEAMERRLAAIVDSSGDAIFSCDEQGRVTNWNRGAEVMFRLTSDQVVGRSLSEFLENVDSALHPRSTSRSSISEDVDDLSRAIEITQSTVDGRRLILSVAVCDVPAVRSPLSNKAAICRDISDIRRRDEELQRRNDELLDRDRHMRALVSRLNDIRENERTRISREVHDELGQLLTGLKMDLRWVRRRIDGTVATNAAQMLQKLDDTDSLIDRTIVAVQRIAVELRPGVLDAFGLAAAIRDETRRFELRTGVKATIDVDSAHNPEPESSTTLFRIFQEILTNVARHAKATSVEVDLHVEDDSLVLQVRDNGIGLESSNISPTSLGLMGMRERAASMGGSVQFAKDRRGGTSVTVRVPFELGGGDAGSNSGEGVEP